MMEHMRRNVVVTLLAVAAVAVGVTVLGRSGGDADVSADDTVAATGEKTSAPPVPDEMSCGPFTFPADTLTAPPIAAESSDPAVVAMRGELSSAAGAAKYGAFEADTSQIRVLDRSEGRTLLGIGGPGDRGYIHGPAPFVAVALEARDESWVPVDWTECSLRLGAGEPGEQPVTWYLATGEAAPDPDARQIPIEVIESACASGQSAQGRIHEPAIDYRFDAIVVTVTVKPLSGSQECPGNPPTPYLLELDEPLNGRLLLDGGRYPPAPPPDPEQPPSPITDLPADALAPDPDGNMVLYVVNESATVTPVEIHHMIDGAVLPQAEYRNDADVTEYRFSIPDGLHQISVAAVGPDGGGQDGLEEYFEVTGPTWLVLRYSGDGGEGSLSLTSHDEQPSLEPAR